jgi:hypothetical protein
MARLPPGIATHCSWRRGWGFWGGTYGYPPAGRGKPPPPDAIRDWPKGRSSNIEGAQATTVQCIGTYPGKNRVQSHSGHGFSTGYRHALPPPRGRGRSAAGAGGVGGAGTALRETGEGGKPPSPSAPPPDVIATTVQCPGERSEEEPAPGTAFPQLSPRTAPAPGAGEEAEGRAGWGVASIATRGLGGGGDLQW